MAYSRVFDLIHHQLETKPKADSLCAKVNGKWVKYSTQDVINKANQVSAALLRLGCQPGDKVGLVANNRPEWNFLDIGMMQIGIINVPVYPTISKDDYRYIFQDAEVKFVFVFGQDHVEGRQHPSVHEKLEEIRSEIPTVQEIFALDPLPGLRHLDELLQDPTEEELAKIKELSEKVDRQDLATLIYTSGTTGNPKGVMLTHHNLVSNVESVSKVIPILEGDRALSFLPLCHSYERTVLNSYLANGVSVYYAENMDKIGDNLKEVQPHYFSTVPRLLEKVYEKIMAKGMELKGFKRKLFFWSLDLGSKFKLHDSGGTLYQIQLSIARKLVFKKWQEALGGNVIAIMTGAAAIQPRLATLFTAAGIDVLEGYGLTETSPVLCCNRMELENRMIGTVGLSIPGVEIRIDPDTNEIQAKGPNIMKGYYNMPEATREVFTEDGWFKTGDAGVRLDQQGKEDPNGKFLKITDRIKELFKTSGGKYIAPQSLENKFKESMYVEQIATIGDNRKFVSALIVPSFLALEDYCKSENIPYDGPEEVIKHEKIQALYNGILAEYNPEFAKFEQIKKFTLVAAEWSAETGELTPTMKPKRRVIYDRYDQLIDAMYA
jgi:long-chain acyl-CoA synthetase